MARARFECGKQKEFVEMALRRSDLKPDEFAQKWELSRKTIDDWKREKFLANYEVIKKWEKAYNIDNAAYSEENQWWYTRKGGIRCSEIRAAIPGNFGTPEGRKRGGVTSQENRKLDSEKYRQLGCIVRKKFHGLVPSNVLAECVGIILGDGSISRYQVCVSLDRIRDREYASVVKELFSLVFGDMPSVHERPEKGTIDVVLSGVALSEELVSMGLVRGDKVRQQVAIPNWIYDNPEYSRACVRGLFDTDGSLYAHRKTKATYYGWTFTNYSRPLLNGVARILRANGFDPKQGCKESIFMYNRNALERYFDIFGTNNPKNSQKYSKYRQDYLRVEE